MTKVWWLPILLATVIGCWLDIIDFDINIVYFVVGGLGTLFSSYLFVRKLINDFIRKLENERGMRNE